MQFDIYTISHACTKTPKLSRIFGNNKKFGCLGTNAHVLLFTASGGTIWIIDTWTWTGKESQVKCPADSLGNNGLFTWMMANTDERIVDGFARRVRGVPQDVRSLIRAFTSTLSVHMFMRGNGPHWAMKLDQIFDGKPVTPVASNTGMFAAVKVDSKLKEQLKKDLNADYDPSQDVNEKLEVADLEAQLEGLLARPSWSDPRSSWDRAWDLHADLWSDRCSGQSSHYWTAVPNSESFDLSIDLR